MQGVKLRVLPTVAHTQTNQPCTASTLIMKLTDASTTHHFKSVAGNHLNGAPGVRHLKGVGSRLENICYNNLIGAVPKQVLCGKYSMQSF